MLQIKRDAAFRGIVVPEKETPLTMRSVVEKWPYQAGVLPTWRLDLDNICPQIGHQLATELALLVSQFEDPETVQRAREDRDLPCWRCTHVSVSSM
jgi:hypothetical protein